MQTIKITDNGIEYLTGILKEKKQTITKAIFWKIQHNSGTEEINLKIGRYKCNDFTSETLENSNPKSALTLDDEEFSNLINFISANYKPFQEGIKKYLPLDGNYNEESVHLIRNFFNNPNKQKVLDLIEKNHLLSDDLMHTLQYKKRVKEIQTFEEMLEQDVVEQQWQKWFQENDWVLCSDHICILDERKIDANHISDFLVKAHDGFLDVVEIKRPGRNLSFWSSSKDHDNYIPSSDLIKAIIQATYYIYELEREANSQKFIERVGSKVIKPRCILIFGRSYDWDREKCEAYRILNSSYHNLTILTYDHVLTRAKRIVGISSYDSCGATISREFSCNALDSDEDLPF